METWDSRICSLPTRTSVLELARGTSHVLYHRLRELLLGDNQVGGTLPSLERRRNAVRCDRNPSGS